VPAYTIHRLPAALSYEAAALVEPLAVGIHAVKQGAVQPGATVAVLGAGPIGLSTLQAARVAGAGRVLVFELAERRRALALAMGAEAVLDPREPDVVRKLFAMTDGMGVDVSFDCAGVPASPALAIEVARRGGRAVIVAVYDEPSQLHFNRIMFFEKHVVGAIGYSDEFPATIALLNDGRLRGEPLISAKIGLSEVIAKGFQALVERKDENIKVLVSPEG
jgi:(R,R)-butanediol dehydrogenase/meso-butanediol dehydrogenase/diacetyl reductase